MDRVYLTSTSETSDVCKLLLKELLFLRGQGVRFNLAGELHSSAASSEDKKTFSRFAASVEALSTALSPQLLSTTGAILLVFGASAERPKEAYEFFFRKLDLSTAEPEELADAAPSATAQDAARRLTRLLVASLADAPALRGGTSAFALVRVPCSREGAVPPGFVAKRSLRPAFGKAHVLRTLLCDGGQGACASLFQDAGDNALWCQSVAVVKGIVG